jgi:hypothetical protein
MLLIALMNLVAVGGINTSLFNVSIMMMLPYLLINTSLFNVSINTSLFNVRENLLLCSSYLPLGVPNWVVICPHQGPLSVVPLAPVAPMPLTPPVIAADASEDDRVAAKTADDVAVDAYGQ